MFFRREVIQALFHPTSSLSAGNIVIRMTVKEEGMRSHRAVRRLHDAEREGFIVRMQSG